MNLSIMCSFELVSPDELLGHGILWDFSESTKPRTFFEVDVEAVSEADLVLVNQKFRFNLKGVLNGAAALLPAGNGDLPDAFSKPDGVELVVDEFSLGSDVLLGKHFLGLFEGGDFH